MTDDERRMVDRLIADVVTLTGTVRERTIERDAARDAAVFFAGVAMWHTPSYQRNPTDVDDTLRRRGFAVFTPDRKEGGP